MASSRSNRLAIAAALTTALWPSHIHASDETITVEVISTRYVDFNQCARICAQKTQAAEHPFYFPSQAPAIALAQVEVAPGLPTITLPGAQPCDNTITIQPTPACQSPVVVVGDQALLAGATLTIPGASPNDPTITLPPVAPGLPPIVLVGDPNKLPNLPNGVPNVGVGAGSGIDINGDGKPDFIVPPGGNNDSPLLSVDANNPIVHGSVGVGPNTDGDGLPDVGAGIDLDGDGIPDVGLSIETDIKGDGVPDGAIVDGGVDLNDDGKPDVSIGAGVGADTDGDGMPDVGAGVDLNGDGIPDITVNPGTDTNGDGKPDVGAGIDLNSDDKPDVTLSAGLDTNGDGVPDGAVVDGGIDLNGDGKPDVGAGVDVDTNKEGTPEVGVGADLNGDGKPDVEAQIPAVPGSSTPGSDASGDGTIPYVGTVTLPELADKLKDAADAAATKAPGDIAAGVPGVGSGLGGSGSGTKPPADTGTGSGSGGSGSGVSGYGGSGSGGSGSGSSKKCNGTAGCLVDDATKTDS